MLGNRACLTINLEQNQIQNPHFIQIKTLEFWLKIPLIGHFNLFRVRDIQSQKLDSQNLSMAR